MIHFRANLRALTAERPAVLHFVLDPAASGAFIAHDVESDWVFMHAIDPVDESIDDYDDRRCHEVIDRAAGTELDAEILGTGTWWMSSQTAESMGEGRIFLAGDAAHRFPPTGGLGLNSGIQDIHGLLWRIAAVATGPGYRSLLRSARILLPLSYVLTSAMSPLLPFRFRDLGVAVEWATPATTSWMAARITARRSASDGSRRTRGSRFVLVTVAAARSALSQELIMAASSAPTNRAMATGGRCCSARAGTTDSALSRPGIDTIAIMPSMTGIRPNPR